MTVKICHVTSAHNTNDVRILKKECTSLAKSKEYEVYLVGQGDSYIYKNVNVVGVGTLPNNRFKRMSEFAKKVVDEALKIDADIYHLHDPELLRLAVKFKNAGKKVIFDSHENVLDSIEEKTYMPIIIRKIFKIYYKKLQKRILPQIDGIVVVTPQMIDIYKEYNENIVLITNYPILEQEKKVQTDNDTTFVKGRFIFAGGISEQWSHKEIINAIDEIDGIEYRLFGPADEEYLAELKKMPGWSKVYYGGKISYEEVQEEMKKAQFAFALLKPSRNSFYRQGTLGNTKLFEAMGNGKPVIATDFDLWKPIVEENRCGVCVDPADVMAIRRAIFKMFQLANKEYNIMRQRCNDMAIKKYNWNNEEEKLFQFYYRIIKL